MKKFAQSCSFAVAGLVHVFRLETNMRVHGFATLTVIALSVWLKLSTLEWALVLGCCGAVMAFECINTAVERLADRVTTEQDPLIKVAKDCSAGSVLIVALTAAIVGALVLLPKLLTKLGW